MKSKENLTLIDIPLNIFGLEVFDFLLAFLFASPFLILGLFIPEFLVLYLIGIVGIGIFFKIKKRDKGYGYIKRWYARSVRKLLGQRKVIHA
jgi:Zn-dependent protease with chaperone function